jgi:hypothetical protein
MMVVSVMAAAYIRPSAPCQGDPADLKAEIGWRKPDSSSKPGLFEQNHGPDMPTAPNNMAHVHPVQPYHSEAVPAPVLFRTTTSPLKTR